MLTDVMHQATEQEISIIINTRTHKKYWLCTSSNMHFRGWRCAVHQDCKEK